APGNYRVDIQASAFLADSTPVSSDVTTYYFQVDDTGGPPGAASPQRESEKDASAVVAWQSQGSTGLPAFSAGPLSVASKQLAGPTQTDLLAPAGRPVSVPAAKAS